MHESTNSFPVYGVLGNPYAAGPIYATGPISYALGPWQSEFVQRVADKGCSRKLVA